MPIVKEAVTGTLIVVPAFAWTDAAHDGEVKPKRKAAKGAREVWGRWIGRHCRGPSAEWRHPIGTIPGREEPS